MILYNKIKVLDMDFYIATHNGDVVYIDTQNNLQTCFKNQIFKKTDDKFSDIKNQLEEYFQGKRQAFTFNYMLIGSAFSKSVWTKLSCIPFGSVISYKQLSAKIGDTKKVRAVANAVGKNPLLVLIPCHRVIGNDGRLHGFRSGVDMKKRLLRLEGIEFKE